MTENVSNRHSKDANVDCAGSCAEVCWKHSTDLLKDGHTGGVEQGTKAPAVAEEHWKATESVEKH